MWQGSRSAETHHVIPGSNDTLHVEIAGEESDDSIRHDFAVLDEDASKISDDGRVVSDLEAGAYGNLVTTAGNDLLRDERAMSGGDSLTYKG